MAETTEISWADATFNPWIGCTKVGAGCDHCYAERDNARRKWVAGWGPGVPRRRTKTWGDPLRWDRAAALSGQRPRVFCASLADVFDNEVEQAWRNDLWALIRATPNLRWMLLTKRIGNATKMLPPDWPYPNAGLMATVVNQAEVDRDVPKLLTTPATWRGLSIEPMLGAIDLSHWLVGLGPRGGDEKIGLDWVICGGESGPQARPMSLQWARELRDQCAAAGTAFFFKQWGEWAPAGLHRSGDAGRFAFGDYEHDRARFFQVDEYPRQFTKFGARSVLQRVGRKKAGWLLDGREHKAFPAALAA